MKSRIHRIKREHETVLFFCDSLTIVKVTDEDEMCIDQIINGLTEADAQKRGDCFLNIYRKNKKLLEEQQVLPQYEAVSDDDFSTLILHVSNDCNMKCAYCFANHGRYASAPSMMTEATAIQTLNLFYSKYKKIKEIKFFGGEPLMNMPVIEAVCEYVYEKYDKGELSILPRFKVITNGTILTDQILDTAIKYRIQIVFSLDGPPSIHDTLRYFQGKKPSYDLIIQNFWHWKEKTNGLQPCSIETTYTSAHIDAGYSIPDVVSYFQTNLKMKSGQVNVSLVNLPETNTLNISDIAGCWSSYAEEIVERLKRQETYCGDLKLMGLIYRLKNKKTAPEELCPAGKTWSAVSATGNVYPCLMFMDNVAFYMGNVGENIFQSSDYQTVVHKFQSCHPKTKSPCSTCFVNQVCNKCAGINYFCTGNIDGMYQGQCEAMKRTIEILICAIADGIL